MMKKIYFTAWLLAAAAALVSIFTGNFNAAAMVAFSLIALGLVFTLALWSVIANTRDESQKSL